METQLNRSVSAYPVRVDFEAKIQCPIYTTCLARVINLEKAPQSQVAFFFTFLWHKTTLFGLGLFQ
jgi:hypothetical protein